MVVYACNPSTPEQRGGLPIEIQANLTYNVIPHLKNLFFKLDIYNWG